VKTAETFRNGQDIDTGNVGDMTWGISKQDDARGEGNHILRSNVIEFLVFIE
jgi:hypothetical protein